MIDASTRATRLQALRGELRDAGAELAAIAPTDHLRWLLGFAPHPDERACLLLVSDTRAAMLMPALNAEGVAVEVPELELVRWTDDAGPAAALASAAGRLGVAQARLALADPEMRADHLMLLQQALADTTTVSAGEAMGRLRSVKDGSELERLRASAAVADRAVRAAFAACAPGVSEAEVAEAVSAAFREAGATPEFGIVAGGPHGAFPHHEAGPRPLAPGDAVVIDIGGRLDGYVSDITRMAFLGDPSPRYREVHAIVEAAVSAGIAAARPGARCTDVDAAARTVIDQAGYGEYFVHRTGHGLGLSIHEPPWIMAGDDTPLAAGMVHSVEPGIYLPGEFGIRLEDIVEVTPDGGRRFSSLTRDVHVADA